MLVEKCMSKKVELVSQNASIQEAAAKMKEFNCGALPVASNDRLVGVITDRDIVVRTIAAGLSPIVAKVHEAMSYDVFYCYDDEDIDDVAAMMSKNEVCRMPVVNRDKRLVGIISRSDLTNQSNELATSSLANIARIH
ncbi:MAG: CBS domain-containing protein [Bdellovibrionales bacterium]|nr:CBS domain-containing protein [Bdellovibrionales bacterium]